MKVKILRTGQVCEATPTRGDPWHITYEDEEGYTRTACNCGCLPMWEEVRLPWHLKDHLGWPIEMVEGRPFQNLVRIILQNVRKLPPLCWIGP